MSQPPHNWETAYRCRRGIEDSATPDDRRRLHGRAVACGYCGPWQWANNQWEGASTRPGRRHRPNDTTCVSARP